MLASANNQSVRDPVMDLIRENGEDLPAGIVQDTWQRGIVGSSQFQGEAFATEMET